MSSVITSEKSRMAALKEKRSAALFSVLAAFGITVLKFLTGILTGSLGMLSEAAHSTVDLIAAGITLFSVQVSDRPADDSHNYGHGKVESLSAFVESVLMLGSCVWIVTEAIRRITSREHLSLTPSPWPFVVLILSIVVDFTRSRKLHKIALESSSQALEADAIHFSTDIWSSLAVVIGLAASFVGNRWKIPWLELADPFAALVVSGIILHVTWGLARRTIDALLDATPKETREATRGLERELKGIAGVLAVNRFRTRRSGADYFADLTLGLAQNLTFQRTEQITQRGNGCRGAAPARSRCRDSYPAHDDWLGKRSRSRSSSRGANEPLDSRCVRVPLWAEAAGRAAPRGERDHAPAAGPRTGNAA